MLKKMALTMLVLGFSASIFAAEMTCSLSDAGNLIQTYSATLDETGSASIETEQYDLFFFGAEAQEGSVVIVWAGSEEDAKKSSEPLDITETSSRGTEIKFTCDVI